MAFSALQAFSDDSIQIDFGDSAIGTGALFLALKQYLEFYNHKCGTNFNFLSAVGVDIDKDMAEEAFVRYSKRGLSIIYGDSISPGINLGPLRNLMLVNPPYNRHENIPREYRLEIARLAKKQTGIKVKGDSGLYVYHLLIMDKWLAYEGIAVWLLPTIFLQSRYGDAIRNYLLNNVDLISLHIYDDEKQQFANISISTTIVTFKKRLTDNSNTVSISYGESAISPSFQFSVNKQYLFEEKINWRNAIYNSNNSTVLNDVSNHIKFDDIFDIKRGIATGANDFFVMDRQKAKQLNIPNDVLIPLLPKARNLNSLIINQDNDGYPNLSPQLVLIDTDIDEKQIRRKHPDFFEYLQKAKIKDENGKSIIDRALVKGRTPWYKQERRNAPLYLLTYMGRNKKDLPPLYFILNRSKAIALNTYILLYPKNWLMELLMEDMNLQEIFLVTLNKTAEQIISQQARIYSGGLQKIEPGELKRLSIIDLPKEISDAYDIFTKSKLSLSHSL